MESMEKWRNFFKGAGTDICSLIEYAILVAASDCPNELRKKRARIAQRLYASRCRDCRSVTLAEPCDEVDEVIDDEDVEQGIKCCHDKDNDKVSSPTSETDGNRVSNCSYDEAEALTEEIDKESQVLRDVFRIRDILANPEEAVTQLHECLRRLELMQLTVEILEATEIGKLVNRLRKHNSMEIQSTVKRLISGWKDLVDEWVKTAGNAAIAAIAGTLPDSVSPTSADGENGLPSPPLDEGAFMTTQMTSIEISQILDGIDDDRNPQAAEKTKNDEYDDHYDVDENQCTIERPNKIKQSANQINLTRDSSPCVEKERGELKRNAQIQVVRDCHGHRMSSSSSIIASSDPGRPPISSEYKGYQDNVQQHPDLNRNQTMPVSFPLQNFVQQKSKSKSPDDASVKAKLEAAKRKLHEGYQKVENAKKQRMVQAIKLQDLPEQGPKLFHGRPVSQRHRQWMNKRR